MRSSWNFSTVIFEIWVLVLTKPGWANETPTTSLKVPGEYNYHNQNHNHHHHVQHQHHHHNQNHNQHQSHYQHEQHYSVEGSRDSNSNHNHHHHSSHPHQNQPRSLASTYYSNGNNHHHTHHLDSAASSSSLYTPHRCYACLPPNKNSKEAQQILKIFAKEVHHLIPDCSAFDPYVDTARFEFDCPPDYGGCILRIHGFNISRACSRYRMNECKKANSVEFCYCNTSLCNDRKPEPAVIPAVVHVSRTTDVRRRGSSGSIGNSRSRSSSSQIGENSQGIRSRVSDDEDILNRDDDEDDDDDNGGSGTGSPDQQLQTLIDPFTSTMDPTIFHEETVVVAVEDPNPHTKIGISMTASTSSSSSSSVIATSWSWSSSQGATKRCGSIKHSIFHLFVHLHRTMFVHLFAEQVVDDQHDADDYDRNHYFMRSNQNQESKGEKMEAAETTGLPFILYSQLCFIISLVVLNGFLS